MKNPPPLRHTNGWTLAVAIYDNGPLTIQKGISIHGKFGAQMSHTSIVYERGVKQGWLLQDKDTYLLSVDLEKRMGEYRHQKITKPCDVVEIVQPRTPIHKPWSGKYNIKATANRDDPWARNGDHSIHYSGSGAQPLIRGVRVVV